MVTIKDIAQKLGISNSTVSKGLNGASDISEEMRQLVLDTAVELGYVMKTKSSATKHKISIMVENMNYENIHQFGYEIITSFRLAATEKNYEVSVLPMDIYMQAKQTYDNLMLQNGYSGAFFLGFELEDAYLKQLEHTTIPTVLLDNQVLNKHVGYIGTDNNVGIYQLIEHLYENGHRKIALLNGSKYSFVSGLRYNAFISAMQALHLVPEESLIKYGSYEPDCAKNFVSDFVDQGATAIVCASDLIASGVINELNHLGKRVPNDISVTGFDDLPVAKYLAPPLTTVRQNRFALGQIAFRMLYDLIHDLSVSTILMNPELIIRESVAKITND